MESQVSREEGFQGGGKTELGGGRGQPGGEDHSLKGGGDIDRICHQILNPLLGCIIRAAGAGHGRGRGGWKWCYFFQNFVN